METVFFFIVALERMYFLKIYIFFLLENDISRVSKKDTTNGHAEGKKSTHSGKFNHKHRRFSHGNRKKK